MSSWVQNQRVSRAIIPLKSVGETPSLPCLNSSFCLYLHRTFFPVSPCLCVSNFLLLSLIWTLVIGLRMHPKPGITYWDSFLNQVCKDPIFNEVTFTVPGVQTWTYLLGDTIQPRTEGIVVLQHGPKFFNTPSMEKGVDGFPLWIWVTYPLNNNYWFLSSPRPWKTLMYFLPLWICPF